MIIATACCLGLSTGARADIYAYADVSGVTHYSNVPDDTRYARILAEPVTEPVPAAPAVIPLRWEQRARAYATLIDQTAAASELDPALLRAVIAVESGFDVRAVSKAGAQGLMQLHPATARRYGVAHPFDAGENLRGGAHYLADLLRRYGQNLELALAAYNAGEQAVDRYGGQVPPFRETRAYVPSVLKLYGQLRVKAV